MNSEPVLYDPETDTLLVELRPWPAASPAEVNEQVGGDDAEDGLVVHYGPDGLPHALRSTTLGAPRPGGSRPFSPSPRQVLHRLRIRRTDMITPRLYDDGTVVETLRDGSERPVVPRVEWARLDAMTEEEIAAQIAEDDAEAVHDAAAYASRSGALAGQMMASRPMVTALSRGVHQPLMYRRRIAKSFGENRSGGGRGAGASGL